MEKRGSRFSFVWAPALAALVLVTACQPVSQSPKTGGSPRASATHLATPSPTPSPTPPPKHVFVIVLENTSYQRALAQPYIASLASQYAIASNYHAIGHPSLPNYLALTAGSTFGIADDAYHPLPATGVAKQLTDAGISWKGYFEGFAGNCFNSPYPYALKHNPFAYFGGQCPANVVPMSQLAADLSGDTPQLSWITPGLCNDGHDCSTRTTDGWLSEIVPQITGSSAWQQNGVLFITWDEGTDARNQVAMLTIAPRLHGEITQPLDHYSLLATIEDALGVPRLGLAKQAASLNADLNSGTIG